MLGRSPTGRDLEVDSWDESWGFWVVLGFLESGEISLVLPSSVVVGQCVLCSGVSRVSLITFPRYQCKGIRDGKGQGEFKWYKIMYISVMSGLFICYSAA